MTAPFVHRLSGFTEVIEDPALAAALRAGHVVRCRVLEDVWSPGGHVRRILRAEIIEEHE